MTNAEARVWYNQQLESINIKVAFTEDNARLISGQRNALKAEARLLMSDRNAATALDKTDPLRPFDYYVDKYKSEGYEGESLWQKIIESGKKPNVEVNKKFGIK